MSRGYHITLQCFHGAIYLQAIAKTVLKYVTNI